MDQSERANDRASARLIAFPVQFPSSDDDEMMLSSKARPYDVAEYIAEMLQQLENLAQQNRLDVLALMIAMAREQANDDTQSNRAG